MIRELYECRHNLISKNSTIISAMGQLDRQPLKVLFIVDDRDKLIAALTDGDIRRAILKGIKLESTVDEIANHNPVTAGEDVSYTELERIMNRLQISAIPILDGNGVVKRVCYKGYDIVAESEKINVPVVIMAGGEGKRLYPYTKILPKPLIPIEDTPISERIIDSFIDMGCREFYMIVNYKKGMIKSYFGDISKDCDLRFVDEEKPLGTGGGLQFLKGIITKTFVLTNCDILILERMRNIVDHHIAEKNDVTMVCSMKDYEIPYGIVKFAEGGEISSFEEKPHMSFFTNTGYYVLEPIVMEYINRDERVDMPDIIGRMRKDGRKVGVYPISESSWLDMGQFDSMEGMERRLRELSVL